MKHLILVLLSFCFFLAAKEEELPPTPAEQLFDLFSDTLVDQVVRSLLAPYVAQKVG